MAFTRAIAPATRTCRTASCVLEDVRTQASTPGVRRWASMAAHWGIATALATELRPVRSAMKDELRRRLCGQAVRRGANYLPGGSYSRLGRGCWGRWSAWSSAG